MSTSQEGTLPPRAVFLMSLCCALAVSTIYYHQPLLPQMVAAFGEPLAHAGFIATVTQLGYAAGLLLFVPLGDRWQPRTVASVAIAANAIALLASAAAPSFVMLVAASFLVGLTAVTAQIIIPAVSRRVPAGTRGRIMGSLLSGLSSGLLLARTLSGVVGAQLGWRAIFVLAAVADLALFAMVRTHLPQVSGLTTIRYRDLMRSMTGLLRQERLLRFSAATAALLFGAFSALWASLAVLLARPPYAFGPAAIGAFGLVGLVGIVSSSRVGALVDRLGPQSMVSAGALATGLAYAFVAASGRSLVLLVLGMLLLDFGNRAGLASNQSRIYALRPDAGSRLNTVLMVSYFLGGATGAALGAWGAHRAGWAGLAVVGGVLALAALAVNAWAGRTSAATTARQELPAR